MRKARMRCKTSSAAAAPTPPRSAPSSAPRSRLEEGAMIPHTTDAQLSRRTFLSTTGALVVSLAAPGEWSEALANTQATRPPLKGDQLSSYITIEPDGSVVAYYGKIDGGQGLGT